MALIEDISSGALGIAVLLIILALVIGAVIGISYLISNWKKYQQFDIEIWQQDGFGQFNVKHDSGGIFIDGKTKNKRLFLKKANVGLDPDNIPYLPSATGKKKILLLQTGLKNFKFIKPVITGGLLTFTVGEEDVNWAINSYERQKKLFAQSWLIQYMPFIMLAFTSIIILILFINLFKQIPEIKEIVLVMREIAASLAQAKAGTVIIP